MNKLYLGYICLVGVSVFIIYQMYQRDVHKMLDWKFVMRNNPETSANFSSPKELGTEDFTRIEKEESPKNVTKGQETPTVCWHSMGRLGNQICEYVHLLHINASYSVRVTMHPGMRKALNGLFPSLSVKGSCNPNKAVKVGYPEILEKLNATTERDTTFHVKATPCGMTILLSMKKLWKRDFIIHPKLKEHAASRLQTMTERWTNATHFNHSLTTLTIVGVHVRRSDYKKVLRRHGFGNMQLLPPEYHKAAFEYYRNRFGNVLFIVITEPKEYAWCRKNLAENTSDVILADDRCSAKQDLALLSSFKHIIYSFGTFGLWGILLGNVTTVAYPHPDIDHGKKRYSFYKAFDEIREENNETEYIQVNF